MFQIHLSIKYQLRSWRYKVSTCSKISALHLNAKMTNNAPRKPIKLQIPERALNFYFDLPDLSLKF